MRRGYSRYRPYIHAGVRFGARVAGRAARNWIMNKMTSYTKTRSGAGVTDQYDKKTIYRKKRMPRRQRKRWSKKKRGFDAMLLKRLATKTVVFNDTLDTGNWVGGLQRNLVVHLYGKYGTDRGAPTQQVEVGTNDVYTTMNNDNASNESIEKICYESAILDFTTTNSGTSQLEVDVYEFYTGALRQDTQSWGFDQSLAQAATPLINGGPGNMDLDARGVTPFEFPLMSRYGWKILKKTKYLLSPGKAFTYQVRDPKNRWVAGADVYKTSPNSDLCLRGATRSYLFIAKQVAGQPTDEVNRLVVGATRVYRYKILENNRIESEYGL